MKKFIPGTSRSRKRSAQDMSLRLLGYGTLLSKSDLAWGNNSGQWGKEVAVVQRRWFKILQESFTWIWRGRECVQIVSGSKWRTITVRRGNLFVHPMGSIEMCNKTLLRTTPGQETILLSYHSRSEKI